VILLLLGKDRSDIKIDNKRNCNYHKGIMQKKIDFKIKLTLIYIIINILFIYILNFICSYFETIYNIKNIDTIKIFIYLIIGCLFLFYAMKIMMRKFDECKKEIEDREKVYEKIVECTTQGIFDIDLNTLNVNISKKWKKILGYNGESKIYPFDILLNYIHIDDIPFLVKHLEEYLNRDRKDFDNEFRVRCSDYEYKWIHAKGQAFWSNNKPVKIIGTLADINSQKDYEENLKRIIVKNEKIINKTIKTEKMKTEFFANMSHELRTPLNVILATIQLFEFYNTKADNRKFIENIPKHIGTMKNNCFRLIRLVNNLIDLSKIETGYLKLNRTNVNIVELIEDIAMSVSQLIESKSIRLIFDTNTEEKIVALDCEKLERIILNLLSNAVKFTNENGTIWLNVIDKGSIVSIIVADTGIGIPSNKRNHIFKRFGQVQHTSQYSPTGSSGIGLSLVKHFVELHNGTISVESEYGKGSKFTINIPVVVLEQVKLSINKPYKNKKLEKTMIEFSDVRL